MNALSIAEKKALELMQKDNFRGISKDNVMQLMSILDKVDPEVAKSIIAQLPEAIRGSVELEKAYSTALTKGMESIESTASSCFQTEDEIIQSLKKEVEREDATFEQKQFYYEKMEAVAIRKESKETEHRDTILTILRYGGEALLFGLGFCACLFLGKADLKNPIRS